MNYLPHLFFSTSLRVGAFQLLKWMDDNFQALLSKFVSGEIQENFRSGNRRDQTRSQVSADLAELNPGHAVKQIHENLKYLKQQSERSQQL